MSELALVGAVAAQQCVVSADEVVALLRRAVEEVVVPTIGVDLAWTTYASNRSDDLSSGRVGTSRGALDWDFAERRLAAGAPEQVSVSAQSTLIRDAVAGDYERFDPRVNVTSVAARFPVAVAWAVEPVCGLVLRVYLQRWAFYRGLETATVARLLTTWVVEAAEAIGADAGYVSLGPHPYGSTESPWELEQRLAPNQRDVVNKVWGFGWGTLVGSAQLAVIGGTDALRGATTTIRELPGGRVWAQIGDDDPERVTDEQLTALQRVLGPALPTR